MTESKTWGIMVDEYIRREEMLDAVEELNIITSIDKWKSQ